MRDTTERLYVQRKWLSQNPFAPDAMNVAEQALQDAIGITEFTPNATFYREITTPFASTSNAPLRNELLDTIDGQQLVIQSKGPIVDYVRLQLQLAHCNLVDDELERAVSRLEDLYFEVIEPLSELEVRITCLAWFSAELKHIDPTQRLVGPFPIDEIIEDDMEITLNGVLTEGAFQFTVLSNALSALSLYRPDAAISMAGRLNTSKRRQEAYFHIVHSICKADTIVPVRETVCELLHLLKPGIHRNIALEEVAERFSLDYSNKQRPIEDIELYYDELTLSTDPSITAQCLANMVVSISESSDNTKIVTVMSGRLINEFYNIGAPVDRYRMACQLVAELKPACPKLADKVFEYLKNTSGHQHIPRNIEHGIFYVFDLLVKSLSALARSGLLRIEDVRRVCTLIHDFNNLQMQVRLFSTLAFYLWRTKASETLSIVLDDYLWPVINGLSSDDPALTYTAWIAAYPAIWLEDRDRARNAVSAFPADVRDDCTTTLIFCLLRGEPTDEPFDDDARNIRSKLTYYDLRNLMQLADESENDSIISIMFEWIADELTDSQEEIRLSREQRADISQRMLDIANTKFPMKSGIQHAGYQVLCQCQSLRIHGHVGVDWPKLIRQAERIENVADRIYVLAHITSYLPGKLRKERNRILSIVEHNIDDLRVQEDQFQRYCTLSDLLSKRDRPAAKGVVEKAFRTTLKKSTRRDANKESHLVELAYRLDPDLPMNLGLLYDSDPARAKFKERTEKQLERYKLKKDLGDYRSQINLREIRNDSNLASAAWRALGTLNCGRMIATDMARVRQMLISASRFPLKTSYPMYSWALSNVMIKYATTPVAAAYVRDMFEGVLRSAKFILEMSGPETGIGFEPVWQDLSDDSSQIVIESGEREKALRFLREWFEEYADESITIVDPYFGMSDLHLLLQIVEVNPWLKVHIVTGRLHQNDKESSLAEAYAQAWRGQCDHSPPETDIMIVGTVTSGAAPFHDRWILSKSAGLHLGSSVNSLGSRDSVITRLRGGELERTRRLIEKYLARQIREVNGERISYELFELVV